MNPQLIEQCSNILKEMNKLKDAVFFRTAINIKEYKEYPAIVRNPMDLNKIKKALSSY